ncbi:MAG: branched-chain amino acid ABC transporter permease/ATP-binding protein, partial [Proteobacteria bacterium]|nr:branched-chain amino acid ABC transporter permease/ATP-binding protein [Pseudomonadota bacterium]
MLRQRRFLLVESIAAVALIVAPFVLPHLGFAPTTIDRILIMGLVGIGFDLLFGYTGLLSFGQSAFFGSGGMVAAWLLTQTSFGNTIVAVLIGTVVAGVIGYLVGLVALRRTGIYFAMITVAIAEVFFFVEFNPLSQFTGGENGLPGVPPPNLSLGFTTLTFDGSLSMYAFFAFWYFVALVLALRIVRSPVGLVLRAIRENPLRAQALGHNILRYKLLVFVIAAMYAGFGGGLLGLMQGFMPPDAFMFSTSGEIVIMTAIGGAGTLVGPLLGATVWLYLSDFFQTVLKLGATWKLVLGLVFVLLVIFLRHGLVGGIKDLYELMTGRPRRNSTPEEPAAGGIADPAVASAAPPTAAAAGAGASGPPAAARPSPRAEGARTASHLRKRAGFSGPILQATGLSKHYGGVIANSDIDFSVNAGELRGIIGPNGAGK